MLTSTRLQRSTGGAADSSANSADASAADTADASSAEVASDAPSSEVNPDVYPALHPAMPQIQKVGAGIIAAPVVVPVYFKGETQQASIDAFVAAYAPSTEWKAQVAEYGVGSASEGCRRLTTSDAAYDTGGINLGATVAASDVACSATQPREDLRLGEPWCPPKRRLPKTAVDSF